MAKTYKVPKTLMGFKLSKGTRKDLKKLLKMVGKPDTRSLALSVATALAAFLAERFAEYRSDKQDGREKAQLAH
jgi:hypothetical protein